MKTRYPKRIRELVENLVTRKALANMLRVVP